VTKGTVPSVTKVCQIEPSPLSHNGKPEQKGFGWEFAVKGLFSEYSYEGTKRNYCGPAALYLISGIRKADSQSPIWKPMLTLLTVMLIIPLRVIKGETVPVIEQALSITGEVVRRK